MVVAWLCHNTALAQTRIEIKDKATIAAKVVSYNEQLIHFQTLTGTLDSIPTEQVSAIGYGDSLRVLVFPESMKGKRQLLTQTQFLEAMQASNYATLFHGYTHLYDVQFSATKSGLLLTRKPSGKIGLMFDAQNEAGDTSYHCRSCRFGGQSLCQPILT